MPQPTLITPTGEKLTPAWTKHAIFNRQVAELILKNLKDCKSGLVTSIAAADHSKARPGALNTVALLRVASSGLGLAPHHAMQLAERLYTSGMWWAWKARLLSDSGNIFIPSFLF